MVSATRGPSVVDTSDQVLRELIDEASRRLEAGEPVDLDAFIAAHPEKSEVLRLVLPALAVLADLGRSLSDESIAKAGCESPLGKHPGELGDFQIHREVGRGGMGIVYEATQISLNRRVALKVLPFAGALDDRHLARFRLEAQAAAQLHHTNIVPVFAVGCERGVHYYAMQFIDGRTVAALIHDLREGEDPPTEVLEMPHLEAQADHQTRIGGGSSTWTPASRTRAHFRTVAGLGRQAAEALDHAHRYGILHRDIKPANLLVDNCGNLWVTDFGLARVGNDASLTATGDLLGTLRYMSPEQALGHPAVIDERSDVYSLGATLYELLALRPTFGGRDRQEILRQIASEEPTAPRKLNLAVPRELETIVLKAMSKEPSSRYASARELGEDLQRFQEDRPIKARRPTWLERLSKWARRNRSLVTAGAISMTLAMIALAISTAMASTAYRRELAQRQQAQANFALARNAVEDMLTEVGDKTLKDVPGFEPMRKTLLLKALSFYQQFLSQLSADPAARLDVSKAHRRLADIRALLGEHLEARQSYGRAITLLEAMPLDGSERAEVQQELAKAYEKSGQNAIAEAKSADSVGFFTNAVAVRERLAADQPGQPEYRAEWASTLSHLGTAFQQIGRLSEADDASRRAQHILTELVDAYPASARYRLSLGGTLNNFALTLAKEGKLADSQRLFERAVEHTKMALVAEPGNRTARRFLRNQYENLAMILNEQGKPDEALKTIRDGMPLGEALVAESPHIPAYRIELAESYHNMAILISHQRNGIGDAEAEACYRRAIDLYEKLMIESPNMPRYPLSEGVTFVTLAQHLRGTKGPDQADATCRQALDILRKGADRWPDISDFRSELAHAHEILGEILSDEGKFSDAVANQRDAIELWEAMSAGARLSNSGQDELVVAYSQLIPFLSGERDPKLRDLNEAIRLAGKALELRPKSRLGWFTLGLLHYRAEDWQSAVKALERSMELHAGGDGREWLVLAMAQKRLGEKEKAQTLYDRAIGWIEKTKPQDKTLRSLLIEAESLLGRPVTPKSGDREENRSK